MTLLPLYSVSYPEDVGSRFLQNIGNSKTLATFATDNPSIDLLLYVITPEGHFETMHIVTMKVMERQLYRISRDAVLSKGIFLDRGHYCNTDW
jgi:hypothetical protein